MEVSVEKQRELFISSCMDIHRFIENNPIYTEKTYKNEQNDKIIMCNNDKYIKMLVAIDANILKKGFKMFIKDGRGQKHTFIYDKQDRIFKNKKKNKILCPHFMTISIMWRLGLIDDEEHTEMSDKYFDVYGMLDNPSGLLNREIIRHREKTHTGNHYRNKFVSVPPKAIGQ